MDGLGGGICPLTNPCPAGLSRFRACLRITRMRIWPLIPPIPPGAPPWA